MKKVSHIGGVVVHGTRTSKGWVREQTLCGKIITESLEGGMKTDPNWKTVNPLADITCSVCLRTKEGKTD